MIERIKRKIRTGIGVMAGIFRRWSLCVSLVLVLAVACVCVYLILGRAKKLRLYPPHDIAVKVCAYHLMDKFEDALSYSLDRPDKDIYIKALKTGSERYDHLEYKLGPIEIRENESLSEANRVVVPNLSMKIKNLSTGEIKNIIQPKIADTILEKRDTPEGPRWYVLTGKQSLELESTWLNLPRKKVSRSPTIILKKAIVMQILSDGEIVSEKTILYDE